MKSLLSICMMVKNEEKNLPRCLDSLKVLMNSIPSELIIVDTGSEDGTVEIAKSYTNKVYHHSWNNNFSEMRNISISYAQGEWILIIDADEEIESPESIVEFLTTDVNKPFSAGALLVKNLTLDDLDFGYVMVISPRLFRNNGEFRYEGAVHNMPIFKGNVIEVSSRIIHYGYISTDKELMEKKFRRTSELLKNELKKNPEDIYYLYQLSTTYQMYGDQKEGLKYIERAYRIVKRKKLNLRMNLYVFCQLAKCYLINYQLEKCIQICHEGISLEKEYIDLYFYLASAQAQLEQYEESIESYVAYLELTKNYDKLEIRRNPIINFHTLTLFNEAYHNIAVMYYKREKYLEALAYSQKIDSNDYIQKNIKLIVELCFRLKEFEKLKDYYLKMNILDKQELNNDFIKYLEKHKGILTEKEYISFLKSFINIRNNYGKLCSIRMAYLQKNVKSLEKYISELLDESNLNQLEDFYGDIVYYSLNISEEMLLKIFSSMPEINIIGFLQYLHDTYPTLSIDILSYLEEKNSTKENFDILRTNKILNKYLIFSNNILEDDYSRIFDHYLDNGIKFIQQLYNIRIIREERINDVKNVEEAFFIYMFLANEQENDKLNRVRYLKKAVEVYPEMSKGIRGILDNLQSKPRNIQMDIYKDQVKSQIKDLINKGGLCDAEELISQYENIIVNDREIYSLKAVVLIMNEKLDEAKFVLEKGLEQYPEDFDLIFNLAYVYEQKQMWKSTANLYRKAEKVATSENQKSELRECLTRISPFCKYPKLSLPEKIRVLHGTMEIANQAYTLCSGLKSLDVEAKTLNYYPSYLGYQADYIYNIGNDSNKIKKDTAEIVQNSIPNYDIFHFHFGTTLTMDNSDLPILNNLGKQMFMHHWGSDVRLYSKASKLSKYVRVKDSKEELIKRRLSYLSLYIEDCIVCDCELYEYVKDFYKNVHIIPLAVDLENYKNQTEGYNNLKPVIVHAPTSPAIKGTDYILRAIEELKLYHDFEFILVENMPHEKAKQIYKKADLIIDQLLIGAYGVFAIEAMAMNKPVVTWISDFMKDKYPKDLPIISANPENIKQKIEVLLKDKEMRSELGSKGRKYVEKYHNMYKVSGQLLNLYKDGLGGLL